MAGSHIGKIEYRTSKGANGTLELRVGASVRIGRSPAADVTLDDANVSGLHAELRAEPTGIVVRDLDSRNGTFIADRRISQERWAAGSVLLMGTTKFVQLDGPAETPEPSNVRVAERRPKNFLLAWEYGRRPRSGRQSGSRVLEPGSAVTVGRDPAAEIALDDPKVSRFHLRVNLGNGEVFVSDLGSHNGTLLNGKRITEARWQPSATLTVGDTTLWLSPHDGPVPSRAPDVPAARKVRSSNTQLVRRPADEQAEATRLRVFISYARSDRELADKLHAALERRGFEVIIDRRDLPFGEEWQQELRDLIQSSDTLLFLISAASIASRWCKWELEQVKEFKKRLVPIALEPIPPHTLPADLQAVHVLPAEGKFEIEKHLIRLADTLNTDRSWIKEHSRLYDRACEWRLRGEPADLVLRRSALRTAESWLAARPATEAVAREIVQLIERSQRFRLKQYAARSAALTVTVLTAYAAWQGYRYFETKTSGQARDLTLVQSAYEESGKDRREREAAYERSRKAQEAATKAERDRARTEREFGRAEVELKNKEKELQDKEKEIAALKRSNEELKKKAAIRPSFDCETNKADVEVTICGSARLAALDVEMHKLYVGLLQRLKGGNLESLKKLQGDFIRKRGTCGNTQSCIETAYVTRIAELRRIP